MADPMVCEDGVVTENALTDAWVSFRFVNPPSSEPMSTTLAKCVCVKSLLSDFLASFVVVGSDNAVEIHAGVSTHAPLENTYSHIRLRVFCIHILHCT